jgi:hypothetical protein
MSHETKAEAIAEIARLKQERPEGYRNELARLVRRLQWLCREDDFREVYVNGDKMGYECVGRKCRSTRIQPPI